MAATKPVNEAERLEKLRGYNILDSRPEESFDAIARLAAQICQVPIAVISLVDADRQWFKAKHGLTVSQTPRDDAFCAYAILESKPFVVSNATNDTRFHDNPLVKGDPHIQFYLGVPLTTDDGFNIGSLCAIDTKPRELTEEQVAGLQTLSRVVIEQLELRKQRHDQELVQQALNERTMEAERATQVKSEFLANMSHEIRTPMNGVVGIAELLMNTPLDEEQRELLETLHLSALSLLSLINDILDSSKMEAGMLAIAPEPVVLGEFLSRVERSIQPLCQSSDISFRCDRAPTLPRAVVFDPARVRQILVNLIGNAVKFSNAEGSVVLSVRPYESPSGSPYVQFEITDAGIGISEEDQRSIFDPFVQADSSPTRSHGGTGLGLSISSQLVRIMKGEIGVQSRMNEGSTFWFRIPAIESERGEGLNDAATKSPGGELGQLNVLVAEDNLVNQRVARGLLEQQGHCVTIAANGAEAVEFLEKQPFDLVLMDIHMPIMDGVEAVRLIRAREQKSGDHVPIIALTANAMEGDREKYMSVGMDGYVSKPFTRAGLYSVIEQLISNVMGNLLEDSADTTS